jgi:signal transduction histidine kinase/CheY-like chemotaxis protein
MVFTFLASFLGRKNTQMISEIGTIYMAGMNERIEMHFKSTIDTQLSQLESIVEEIPEENISDYALMEEDLKYSAEGRNFQYLALYSGDGDFEMITGEQVMLADPEPFWESMKKGDKKIAVGVDASANDIVLFGIRAELPMADGRKSIALVAGIPDEYIVRVLALEENDSLVYSHVIRRDGSFVIKSIATEKNSYFEQVRAIVDEEAGKSAETYVEELQSAMRERKRYSTVLHMEGSRSHLYCTSLPNSEWYLVTVMPYGAMDETVSHFSAIQVTSIFIGSGIILFGLLVVFILYLNLSRRQMEELEKAREEAVHATRAKSEFLSNMSHDIRTPMNAIVGMTAIAVANIDDKKQIQNCLKKITLSSKHLLGLINDVLDMSKIESGKLTLHIEQISLREVMDSIVNIVQPQIKEKKQHFSVHIRNVEAEDVYCDSVRLNQVLLNFLSNAIKFTPEGGYIEISLYEEPSPIGDTYVRVHIKVKDNGIGMSDEFKKTIFEAFTREDSKRVQKTEGTGLGMAITKYILDAMEGTVEVNSKQGEGTEFHVILDLEKVLVQEEEMILPDWHMLVVDDDEQLCESVIHALKDIGINAEWTLDGEAAVELVKERHKQQNDFQIILLDWKLPGMDGIETARSIRTQMGGDIPILLISAYDWNEIEHEAREAGITGFISKPLFKSTLFYGLRQFAETDNEIETQLSEKEIDLTGRKILLAEDNDLNWEIAEALLTERGLELEWAENGQICVDKFKRSPVGFYDAVLMDIRMPVMTGHEAAREIRALDREDADIPIIAMTADAFEEDIKRCMESGMNAHVAKPIDIREVERQLDKFIKK